MQNLTKTILFSLLTLIIFTSCESNNESEPPESEPILLENYYFKGQLDGADLVIETKIYDSSLFNDPNGVSIDYGGSQTNDIEVFGEPGTGFCYGTYAFGLIFYDFQENINQLDAAKMYFSGIPVGDCFLEDELNSIREFLARENYEYRRFQGVEVNNNVALDFFPAELEDEQTYYSSRFGDNTDASFEVTSTKEEGDFFIIEGNFSCKLYKFNDENDYKELENGVFKIKISNNLDE